jgi:hypothetical protein
LTYDKKCVIGRKIAEGCAIDFGLGSESEGAGAETDGSSLEGAQIPVDQRCAMQARSRGDSKITVRESPDILATVILHRAG